MAKQSVALMFRNYIWLADTIYSAGRITREQINRKWANNTTVNYKGEREIPERTFHNWRHDIEDLFEITIQCSRATGEYYIENADDIGKGGIRTWLINTFAVNNLINESHHLKHQILFEKIPSGQRFLTPLIEAMRDKKRVLLTHRKFGADHESTFLVDPYCVKVYQQRWYLLGQPENRDGLRIYGLDRILDVQITDESYRMPRGFDPEFYFHNTIGVSGMEKKPKVVRIQVYGYQANYLRTLPLHDSQKEIERSEEYSIFEYYVVPSFEFHQQILSLGSLCKVIYPEKLVEEFREEAERMCNAYNV